MSECKNASKESKSIKKFSTNFGATTNYFLNFCPPGVEELLEANQLVVHLANFRHDIIFNARNKKRREVINEMRKVLFYVEQEPTQITKGSVFFKVYNNKRQEVIHVFIPPYQISLCCGLSWHCMSACHFQAIIYAPLGVIAGFVRRKYTLFVQEFEILNCHEEILLRIRGTLKDLEIYSKDLDVCLGRMSVHNWVGIMHEVRRTTHDIGLTFPLDLDVHVKCLLLGALFAIEQVFSSEAKS